MTDLHTAAKQDLPDLIAGALGVSRGTAYDMMREALAEAQQEPVDIEHCLWARNGNTPCPHTSTPAQEPVAWLDPWTQDNVTTDYDAYGKHGIPLYTRPQAREPEPPAQGCDFCNNPLYAGTVCKNCGRVAEQPAQSLPFGVGGGLVAIKTLLSRDPCGHANTAIQMIDAILAEQPAQQEPVAWCVLEPWLSGKFEAQDCFSDVALDANVGWVPLYTTPPAAQPAPVQESEKRECMNCAAFGECNPNNDAGRCGYEPPAAQRQWVGLTDEDIEQEFGFIDELLRDCVHRTEAKVREKNL